MNSQRFFKLSPNMFRFSFVLFLLFFSLSSEKLAALEINDLYQASVTVDSQALKQREQAIKQALQAVFLKVGGKKSVLTHEMLQKAKNRASRYLTQYRYQQKGDLLSLVVTFNEDKVNQLFEQAGLALWGSLRPQVLLWLIDEQGASRRIVASDADSLIPDTVNDFSLRRGLPVIMPLMDLTDNEQVVVSDFWGYFPEQIQQASLRYFADTIVVMRVSDSSLIAKDNVLKEEGVEQHSTSSAVFDDVSCGLLCEHKDEQQVEVETPKVLDWRVYTQGALYTQKYKGVNKVALINQGLSDITELIYQSYALLTSAENDFVIEVKNVTSLVSDTQLFNFLTGLSAVKTVTLIQAQGNVRQFKLDLIGSRASFLASLKLNDKLTQKIEPQLGGFTHTETLNNEGGYPSTSESGFNSLSHYGMKVIVLGEPEIASDKQTDIDTLASPSDALNHEPATQQDIIDNGELASKGDTVTDIDNNDLTVKPVSELPSKDPELDVKPVQIIVPSIPVFYWEQG